MVDHDLKVRCKLLHRFEQLAAGLWLGEEDAVADARRVLARVAVHGSPALLAQVFHGILLAWDTQQPVWDDISQQ